MVKGLTILFLVFLAVLNVKADLTQEQKDTLLNLHREARAAVNASNMKELNWDNNLATIAQVNFFFFLKNLYLVIKDNNRNSNKNSII